MTDDPNKKKDDDPNASKKSFVEIEGKKFQADPEKEGEALKDEQGNLLPFEEEEKNIDFKQKLEDAKKEAKEKLDKAEKKIIKLKKARKDGEIDPEIDPDPVDPPISREDVQDIVRTETQKVKKDLREDDAREYARSISTNADEEKLIMFHYKNTVSSTGNLQKDIKRAKLIANEDSIAQTNEEIKKAFDSRNTKGYRGGGGGQRPFKGTPRPKLSPQDEKIIKRGGFDWDTKTGEWVAPSGRRYPANRFGQSFTPGLPKRE